MYVHMYLQWTNTFKWPSPTAHSLRVATRRPVSHETLEGIVQEPLDTNDLSRNENPGPQTSRGQFVQSHVACNFHKTLGSVLWQGFQANQRIGGMRNDCRTKSSHVACQKGDTKLLMYCARLFVQSEALINEFDSILEGVKVDNRARNLSSPEWKK